MHCPLRLLVPNLFLHRALARDLRYRPQMAWTWLPFTLWFHVTGTISIPSATIIEFPATSSLFIFLFLLQLSFELFGAGYFVINFWVWVLGSILLSLGFPCSLNWIGWIYICLISHFLPVVFDMSLSRRLHPISSYSKSVICNSHLHRSFNLDRSWSPRRHLSQVCCDQSSTSST